MPEYPRLPGLGETGELLAAVPLQGARQPPVRSVELLLLGPAAEQSVTSMLRRQHFTSANAIGKLFFLSSHHKAGIRLLMESYFHRQSSDDKKLHEDVLDA